MVAIIGQFDRYRQRRAGSHALAPWLLLSLVLALLLGPRAALAQSEGGASPAAPLAAQPMPLPDVLSEGTLQPKARLWLMDRDGNQILVPEEYAEDYFSSRGQASGGMGLPPATLQRIEVQAEVSGDVARIRGQFSVKLAQEVATSVNLAFGTVQLDQSSFSGESSHNRLLAARDESGWRWIVMGPADSEQTATLSGVSRIDADQERRSLRISLPVAACTLRLKLPGNADDLRVRSEDVLEQTATQDTVEAVVHCRGGEFLISWRDRAEVPQVAAIVANSSTRFEIIDPSQPWVATTTLNLRWYGPDAASQLRIELPPGGQWRALPNSDAERFLILGVDDPSSLADSANGAQDAGQDEGQDAGQDAGQGEEGSPPAAAAIPLLLENFDITRNESLEIELEWDWVPTLPDAESPATEVFVQAPRVLGVDQHTGIIDCVVTSAYAAVFKEGEGAQLIHQAPLMDSFARHQLQFKFDRQPFDLAIVFRREQSLPTIRPTYLVNVNRHKLTLTMWFDCSFDTNQPQMELGLMLDEWVIQENTARMVPDPGNLFSNDGEVLQVRQQVDRNYVIRSASGPSANYGGSRHVDQLWRVVAERTWSAEDHELYFQIPRIIRGRVNGNPEIDHGSGALLVTSQSNVLLTWQETAGTGLQRDSFSTEYQRFLGSTHVRKPMVYRFQSSETTPRWAGRAELLPRQVALEQQAEIEVLADQVVVAQNFQLQVANESLGELRFALRKDVADMQPPQVLINGQLVSAPATGVISEQELAPWLRSELGEGAADAVSRTPPAGSSSKGVWQTFETRGAPEILGAAQVQIRSLAPWRRAELPAATAMATPTAKATAPGSSSDQGAAAEGPATASEETIVLDIPLAQLLLPADARRMRQSYRLQTAAHLDAVITTGDGSTTESPSGGQPAGTLTEGQKSLGVELRPRRVLGAAPVRIETSWLQSFVNSQKRRERYVARVQSATAELKLKLPRAANIREGLVKVAVDGVSQRYWYDQPSDMLTIALPGGANRWHVVEVSYFLPDSLSWASRLSVSPPEILGAKPAEQFYWQLLTPAVHHLAWSPRELTAEWVWQWGGVCWERTSQLNQRQLEELLGTRPQEPPPASANSYVMSGRGVSGPPTAWVLSRFILWFPVGLVAIAVAFAALNYAAVRRPVVVFGMALGIMGLAMVWPDLAALAGQTALLSLGLVALVWVIQAAVDARVRRRSVFSARPSTYLDRSDHISVGRSTRPPLVAHSHGSSTGTGGGGV